MTIKRQGKGGGGEYRGRELDSREPIYESERYTLWPDRVVEGSYTARAVSRAKIDSDYPLDGRESGRRWALEADLSRYPQTVSEYPLLDALYNLSLEELIQDTREDGAFDAGAKWHGVWTRDVSYSIVLALAAIEPEAAKASLLQRVRRGRIVQDSGTGGSWPVSSDRVVWALAAWEIYLVTGDRDWLRQSYGVIRDSVLDDEQVVMSPATGLARGETTFLDWREQTYPRWMEPADIASSEALGTNAVYCRTYRILGEMARLLGEGSEGWGKIPHDWDARAERIRDALNERFWMEAKGCYGQYRYGRVWQTLSPRADALAGALAILFDIADVGRQRRMLESQPMLAYGVPTVFPETPDVPPYHNRSVWPFVQAFWNLAAAKHRNDTALVHGMASIWRAAALFTTNKENFVSDTGSSSGTATNSDRQLWSVAGNLAMVYRVLFGMEFREDGLHLNPVVPEELKGSRRLANFAYRAMRLGIEVRGFGGRVRTFLLDGKATRAVVPAELTGDHRVVIELDDRPLDEAPMHLVCDASAPETPRIWSQGERIGWDAVAGAAGYAVFRNGERVGEVAGAEFPLASAGDACWYQVAAIDPLRAESFLSAPVWVGAPPGVIGATASGEGYIALESSGESSGGRWMGAIAESGEYLVSFRYANGSGPVNTANKCAVRTLFVDGEKIGPIMMPQRGQDCWSEWGESSGLRISLEKGEHRFELRLEAWDRNMSGEVNKALIQAMLFVRIG